MRYAHSRITRFGVFLTAALVSAGCGSSPESTTTDGTPVDNSTWTTSTNPVTDPDTAGGLIWASDNIIHLADHTTFDAGQPMATWVVAGDGVYFTSPDEGPQDDVPGARRLFYTDRDGTTINTGLNIYPESLAASSDGRYLGLIDATSGSRGFFGGYPVATAIIIDITTGQRVVDTTEGMGDPSKQDLAHDYQEIYLRVHFPTDTTAIVEGWGDYIYTLPDGEGTLSDTGPRSPTDLISPDGTWAIDESGDLDTLRSMDGQVIRPRTGTSRWGLARWLDQVTVLGVAISGPGEGAVIGPKGSGVLVTCRVPRGECDTIEETRGKQVSFPNDEGGATYTLSAAPDGAS